MLKKTLKYKHLNSYLMGLLALSSVSSIHAAEEQFNDALRLANSGNVSALEQYRSSMQNDALG